MQIKGMKSLKSKLAKLDSVSKSALKQEMVKEGRVIQRDAKRLAPAKVGDLRRSIKVESSETKEGIKVRVVTNSPHATYVEFGTGPKGKASEKTMPDGVIVSYRDSGWYIPVDKFPDYADYGYTPILINGTEFIFTKGQAAQQFMTPAANKAKKQVSKNISLGVAKRIKKEMVK